MTIESVVFKRGWGSSWETGIMINGDVLIIDAKGKAVLKIPYTWKRTHKLLVELDDTIPQMKGDDNG